MRFFHSNKCDFHCMHDLGNFFIIPKNSAHGAFAPMSTEVVSRCCHCGEYFDKDKIKLKKTNNAFALRRE